MEIDSVMAAAKPADSSTVVEPPPAITPRMIPRMLTRPSWPPRMTSRSHLVRACRSRCRPAPTAAAVSLTARASLLVGDPPAAAELAARLPGARTDGPGGGALLALSLDPEAFGRAAAAAGEQG